MAEIVIRNLRKEFGSFTAVKGSSFTIGNGEFFMLLGPSGCGKTTTLRMIAGLELPTSGEILIDGEDVSQRPASQRDIAFVFQMFALYPHLNVRRNIAYPLVSQGLPRAQVQAKVAEVSRILGIEHILDKGVSGLSGGDRQRVALGRAIVRNPKAFMMDEPLGALDKQLREHMQFEIKHLHESLGITVVYVTHDQGEALTMSDRVAVFNDGRIQQLATPSDLYERPENSFVAQFIGENNKLPGTIESIGDGTCAVRLETGELIDATPVNVTEKGAKTLVSIRPERVEYKPEMMPAGAHTIEAEVMEFIYMGDLFRTRLKVAGSEEFVIKSRNTLGQRMLAPGEKIRIGWAPQDARALDPM